MRKWSDDGAIWTVQDLVAAAEKLPTPTGLLDVDHPDFLLAGPMVEKINTHLHHNGFDGLDENSENAPAFANLIFHSLAARYAQVLKRVAFHSEKHLRRLFLVGGASQNELLNRLTEQATGLKVFRGSTESSTVGNFATQMAALEGSTDSVAGVTSEQVSQWASLFVNTAFLAV
jgi:rhamnulokinase